MSKSDSKQTERALLNSPCLATAILMIVTLALGSSEQTRGWGNNDIGRIGLGNTNSPQPSPVMLAPRHQTQ